MCKQAITISVELIPVGDIDLKNGTQGYDFVLYVDVWMVSVTPTRVKFFNKRYLQGPPQMHKRAQNNDALWWAPYERKNTSDAQGYVASCICGALSFIWGASNCIMFRPLWNTNGNTLVHHDWFNGALT